MTTSAPVSHLQEAQKLTADAEVDLFEVTLKNSSIVYRFTNGAEVTWQSKIYEALACTLTGDTRNADGEEARPVFKVMNPLSIFNEPAINLDLDYAIVRRRRVLGQHLAANVNIYDQRLWYISRVRELVPGVSISLELRNMTDGVNFQIPARQYLPPEFPLVSLT